MKKVGKIGRAFLAIIEEASRLEITLKGKALISYLHLNSLELTQEGSNVDPKVT